MKIIEKNTNNNNNDNKTVSLRIKINILITKVLKNNLDIILISIIIK